MGSCKYFEQMPVTRLLDYFVAQPLVTLGCSKKNICYQHLLFEDE